MRFGYLLVRAAPVHSVLKQSSLWKTVHWTVFVAAELRAERMGPALQEEITWLVSWGIHWQGRASWLRGENRSEGHVVGNRAANRKIFLFGVG